MRLIDYQKSALRTRSELGDMRLNSIHMCLGMASEVPELLEALYKDDIVNLSEEIGDFMWYFCNYVVINAINFDWDAKPHISGDEFGNVGDIMSCVGNLCDYDKKWLAYNKPRNFEEIKAQIVTLYNRINSLCRIYKIDFEDCLQKNHDKLMKRYPEGYNDDSALNRDLEAERRILEGNNGTV